MPRSALRSSAGVLHAKTRRIMQTLRAEPGALDDGFSGQGRRGGRVGGG